MYSPKIAEDLIPILYRLARRKKKPMTAVVDEILRGVVRDQVEEGPSREPNPN